MEVKKELINYLVIASSAMAFLAVVILLDVFWLLRKNRLIARQEKELAQGKIDELIRKNEIERVNALLKGQNSERLRISQELHDRLGGILFTAKLYHNASLKKLKKNKKEEEDEGFSKLKVLLDDAVKEVRRISHDLYAGSLDSFKYTEAMRQLILAIEASNIIEIKLNTPEAMDRQAQEVQHELYAMTQEMLSNTLKHAKATRVYIEIEIHASLTFHYRDNGSGFNASTETKGIGLKNIETRVKKLNGKLHLETSEKQGTSYLVLLPISK